MKKAIILPLKALFITITILSGFILCAQQNTTLDKNNTRPEITRQFSSPAIITSFIANASNGYNEIQWSVRGEDNTRKFIVEYSDNGIYFQSAGEAVVTTGGYLLKHQTFEIVPLLYRLKIEDMEGRYTYSQTILLNGIDIEPVKIYPTIITGNIVNVISDFPVESITVISGSGQPLFTKAVGGKSESMTVELPSSLAKGMYWMNFTGRGWKTTTKFIIP